jgi:segregation and condensation protein A
MTLLLDRLREQGRVVFEALFHDLSSRMEIVVTFLAMLELVKMRAIRMLQEESAGPIVIEAAVGLDEATEGMALDRTEEKQDGA